MYKNDDDPWRFATSAYEQAKYQATLQALPKVRYLRALEVGCSIGVLTERLAHRCDSIVAIDPVERALAQARARCSDSANIAFLRLEAPGDWPNGMFDLILLSEVVYYLSRELLRDLVGNVRRSLSPAGDVVLVHWVKDTDYPLTGDEAAELFLAQSADFSTVVRQQRTDSYRLDVLTHNG